MMMTTATSMRRILNIDEEDFMEVRASQLRKIGAVQRSPPAVKSSLAATIRSPSPEETQQQEQTCGPVPTKQRCSVHRIGTKNSTTSKSNDGKNFRLSWDAFRAWQVSFSVTVTIMSVLLDITAAASLNATKNTTIELSTPSITASQDIFNTKDRIVVTDQAMGARCAVAADFDGDGRMDIVSASSNDNAVSWFHNEGHGTDGESLTFSIKRQITWSSLGSRIVTVADIDGDGDVDVVGASYYDSSLRWFENDGTGEFTSHLISSAVNEGQGVTVADLDNDGDPDIATASSGDSTIAVFKNIDKGAFCEIKEVVDDNAVGARTVVASDFNNDGWLDLASASKDDDSVAWYPNDGMGHFPNKTLISQGIESKGAYSLVAVDIDFDGDNDLVVASNGNNHVSLWRNDGNGNFDKTLIYNEAIFVLSVTPVDFDRDGDIDVASASFFDGYIRWYENVDGLGYEWRNHTVYTGVQGHYVSHGDMDSDGDDDLIAVTHAENTVAVFLAHTECDGTAEAGTAETATAKKCCHVGTEWNNTSRSCETCKTGTYGVDSGVDARCEACPKDACVIPGLNFVPSSCSGITGCANAGVSVAECSCPANHERDPETDTCKTCPAGQTRPDLGSKRSTDTIGNYTAFEMQQGVCTVPAREEDLNQIDNVVPFGLALTAITIALSVFFAAWTSFLREERVVRASQPFFLILICVGTAIMSSSIITFGIDDKHFSEKSCSIACMSAPWLICTGFTIAFSAIFSKLWRINKVVQAALRKIKVTERDVLTPFAVLFTFNLFVLLIWTLVDPLTWSRQPIKDGQNWETYGSCHYNGLISKVCVVLLTIITLTSLFLACVQAYMARAVSDEYSESKFIGIAVICWMQVMLVGLPLLFLVGRNPTALYFLKAVIIFVVSTSLLLLVFVPKMMQVKKQPMSRRRLRPLSSIENRRRTSFAMSNTSASENVDLGGDQWAPMRGNGMRVISPQLEIQDLQKEIKHLQYQIRDLWTKNCKLEAMQKSYPELTPLASTEPDEDDDFDETNNYDNNNDDNNNNKGINNNEANNNDNNKDNDNDDDDDHDRNDDDDDEEEEQDLDQDQDQDHEQEDKDEENGYASDDGSQERNQSLLIHINT